MTRAGRPDQPNASERFHEDKATYTMQGSQPDLAAGVAGLGVLCLPDYMAGRHVASGELLPLFPAWTIAPMPLYLAYPPNRHVSKKLRVFIDWVVELMDRHAPVAAISSPG